MRAEFQKGYMMRYVVLATVCLGLALWFGYDGLIGYPRQLEVAEAYEAIRELPSKQIEQRWREITEEKDWSTKLPTKRPEEIRGDITEQYFFCMANLLVGVPALVLLLKARNSWVERTETGITTSWGEAFDFSTVQTLNKRRWEKKGIAKATYQSGDAVRVFTFDDFKFERSAIDAMLVDLEATLKPEQIVGGPPESAEEKQVEATGSKAPEAGASESDRD